MHTYKVLRLAPITRARLAITWPSSAYRSWARQRGLESRSEDSRSSVPGVQGGEVRRRGGDGRDAGGAV